MPKVQVRRLPAGGLPLAVVLAWTIAALGQSVAFDSASVKRRTEPGGGFWQQRPGGRFVAEGVSLQDLIVFAYDVQPYQIVNGPRWLDTERWDVTAAGGPDSHDDSLKALQLLLADRFALLVRRETRDLPVYALVLARADRRLGPALQRADFDCAAARAEAARTKVIPAEARGNCFVNGRAGSIQIGGSTIADMTPLLATRLQRTVIDRTGLTGPWNATLTYTPDTSQIPAGAAAPGAEPAFDRTGPSIFTAVQEQLGLRLDSTRAPVDVLVIDHAEFAREN